MTNTTFPPAPDKVIPQVQPITDLLIPAIDASCDQAVGIFEREFGAKATEKLDPHLFAHLVRYPTKLRISESLKELGYQIASIPNSGLFIQGQGLEARILKAQYKYDEDHGRFLRSVPNPGSSQARKEYFYQPALMPQDLGDEPPTLKLVYIWDYGAKYQFACLELACPKRYNSSRNLVDLHFLQPVESRGRQLEPLGETEAGLKLADLPLEERAARIKNANARSR